MGKIKFGLAPKANPKCQRIGGCLHALGFSDCCCDTDSCDGQKYPTYTGEPLVGLLSVKTDSTGDHMLVLKGKRLGEVWHLDVADELAFRWNRFGVLDKESIAMVEGLTRIKAYCDLCRGTDIERVNHLVQQLITNAFRANIIPKYETVIASKPTARKHRK